MNDAPSITVVIPVYNRVKELTRALQSLSSQTDHEFEVIVCDDGSEVDLEPVVEEFADKLNLKFIRTSNFGGPARPRNVAILAAEGNWISFLDSDDWWFPDRIATIRPYLRPTVDIVYHQLDISATGVKAPSRRRTLGRQMRGHSPLKAMIAKGNPLPTSATVVRTALIRSVGGFFTGTPEYIEDFDAWLRLAAEGAKFKFIPRVLGGYNIGSDNISTFNERQYYRELSLFKRQLGLLPNKVRKVAVSRFSYLLWSYCLELNLPGDSYFRAISFKSTPFSWILARVKKSRIYWNSLRKTVWPR